MIGLEEPSKNYAALIYDEHVFTGAKGSLYFACYLLSVFSMEAVTSSFALGSKCSNRSFD